MVIVKEKYLLLITFLVLSFSSCRTIQNHSKNTGNSLSNTANYTSVKLSPKVESIFLQMTLDEKIGQLNLIRTKTGIKTGEKVNDNLQNKIKQGHVGGVFGVQGKDKIIEIQRFAVEESRLGIPLLFGLDVIHGYKTTFPIPLALSCSWDMSLIEEVAAYSAREATSDGLNWTFSPMVDISRDPRWGRIAEGNGEDPFLGSAIAKAMVKGYQNDDLSMHNTMMACVKHFANYGAPEGGRDYAAVDMSAIKSHNEYLPPYKAAIDAGVGSVMSSFNTFNYIPATANEVLLKDILRNQWEFSGLLVTDYTSINEMINHGIGDLQEVSAKAINCDVDMDMVGEGYLTTLNKSIEEGKVNPEQIDVACRRILKAKELLGLFDDSYRYLKSKPDLLSTETRNFARKSAAESMVLLKNNRVLPLKKSQKIALIGPLADSRRNMLGCWSVAGDHSAAITVLEGVKKVMGDRILYAKGCNITDDENLAHRVNAFAKEIEIDERSAQEMLVEAISIAKQSDVIVAVLGEAANMTGEASSMANIELQESQKKLLFALKELNKPIVLVLFNGRPMILNWENENLDAILDVWFGGTEAGNAVADVLFGYTNPSGKLTTSFPVHVGQIPVYHSMLNTGRPNNQSQRKFRSNYLDILNEPLFPFGYGLSYTNFEYSDIKLSDDFITKNKSITATVKVKNTGNRKGKEIVQMYIRDKVGSISRPVKELKGFQKIELNPGEEKTVSFEIDEPLLRFYNKELKYISEPGEFDLFIGKNSRDNKKTSFELKP